MKKEITETSPFTGKDSVIVEIIDGKTSKICMNSGYMTNEDFSYSDMDLILKYEESMPKMMIDMKYKDEALGQYWYLTSIQFKTGMIYPQPCTHSEYEWCFAPVIALTDEEKLKYPVPEKDGEYYDTRLATEHSETYNRHDFTGACRRAGAIVTASE